MAESCPELAEGMAEIEIGVLVRQCLDRRCAFHLGFSLVLQRQFIWHSDFREQIEPDNVLRGAYSNSSLVAE